jgi:hypothetical protein
VEPIEQSIRALIARSIARLDAAGVHDEALGRLREPRRFSLLKSGPVMVPEGRAFRLGVVLLGRPDSLFATGQVTRAIEPGRAATNRSQAGELRRSVRAAAAHGRFAEGEVVNYDFEPIDLDVAGLRSSVGPVILDGDTTFVLGRDGGRLTLENYLDDRVQLAVGG